jgi:hypothetical protein
LYFEEVLFSRRNKSLRGKTFYKGYVFKWKKVQTAGGYPGGEVEARKDTSPGGDQILHFDGHYKYIAKNQLCQP